APAKLLIVHELARHRGVGNWEVIAVAGSHAQRPISACERRVRSGDASAAEQAVEKAARPARGVLAGLGATIVLSQRYPDSAALSFALAAVALQSLDVGQRAVEVRAHLLNLVVERAALRRLPAEQGEKAAALATQTLGLLAEAVEFGLLLGRGVFIALDLLRLCGVDRGTAIDRGELAFEPQTGLAACARTGSRGRVGSGNRVRRRRGAERKGELRRCGRSAENEDGQGRARSAQDFRDRCANHGARPDGHSRRWKRRNGDQSVKIPGLWVGVVGSVCSGRALRAPIE